MTIATVTIGHVEVTALLDGMADLPDYPIVEAFPDAPPRDLMAFEERYPGVYGRGGAWRMHTRAWLVRHGSGEFLVDTGLGSTVCMGWFPERGRLHEALAEAGTSADRLDTIVITHVHDDHVGGTVTGRGDPAFPNARHLIQRDDLETARAAANASGADQEDVAIWQTLLAPIEDAGLFQVIEGDVPLAEGVSVRHAPGHTPGHQVVTIDAGDRRLLISGDTWNHPAQLAHPDWASGPDADRARAAATRRALHADLLSRPETIVAPTHFAEPFGWVVDGPDGLAGWEPLQT